MDYRYVGDGVGVPGLPHEISDDEAEKLGVKDLLDEAIANGSFAPAPQMNTFGGKKKIEKGVNNG